MCGIAGFVSPPGRFAADRLGAIARAATTAIAHRGPDDSGVWLDAEAGVAFAHRRLSIIDLSAHGHQPMESSNGRQIIVYNGEIYNYRALRDELVATGCLFGGGSDTEVLLAAIDRWGVAGALNRCNGMFAFALWNRDRRELTLARDRFGQKPLYYGWLGETFAFGSELAALRRHPDFSGQIDPGVLAAYLRHGYVPAPHAIFSGLRKLPAGTVLTLSPQPAPTERLPEPEPYWRAEDVAHAGLADPFRGSEDEAVDALDTLLRDAVSECLVADVPVGAFLSGGIDSSMIVALMQAQSPQPVRTFTIGFHEAGYDEATNAKTVARHLGTDHTELYVSADEAQRVVPLLPAIYSEPFADSSQIPTYLVSQLARRNVTVSLSGDGGDELFGGYNRYVWTERIRRATERTPSLLRRPLARAVRAVPPQQWDRLFRLASSLLPPGLNVQQPGGKLHKLASIVDADSPEEMYWRLISLVQCPSDLLVAGNEAATLMSRRDAWPGAGSFTQQLMLLDAKTYLADDILVKLDRATMAVGLEGRVPLLDHRIMALAWQFPESWKLHDGTGKRILRRVLERYVPPTMFDRPKAGFAAPIGSWLRGGLREWAEDLLAEPHLREAGFFMPARIAMLWREHQDATRDRTNELWPVLMFEAWRRYGGGAPVTATDR